jgi:hypothetical protein
LLPSRGRLCWPRSFLCLGESQSVSSPEGTSRQPRTATGHLTTSQLSSPPRPAHHPTPSHHTARSPAACTPQCPPAASSTLRTPPSNASVSRPPSPIPCIPRLHPTHPPHSQGSFRALRFALGRLPRRAPRHKPLRVALYHPRPPRSLALRRRHLPRSHHPAPAIPPAPSLVPLPHPHRSLRGQSRNLSQHIRSPRGDMAACLGCPHRPRRHSELHGHGCKRPAGRYRVRKGCS